MLRDDMVQKSSDQNKRQQVVSFTAKQTVKEPTVVTFNTEKGRVSFTARVNVQKPVPVVFRAKKK